MVGEGGFARLGEEVEEFVEELVRGWVVVLEESVWGRVLGGVWVRYGVVGWLAYSANCRRMSLRA